ncbi:putative transposase [Pseudoxanthomonas sp. CF385]|uniref:REP-associated tyrosine transposase n=1 Tax=Pseudoxanthomonas sp. CF385 TaxID=1881042 RepID=UPI00088ADE70|nr:transposase [Pseudoxanthomonas sp. CF385]SDQ47733.1 putative transposase [Pseudoxanthomonas sp. CF385]
MVQYRRQRVRGGTYFFTVTLADRSATTLVDHADELRAAIRAVRRRHPFSILAIVVLPDHLHAVLRLPEDDDRYSMRWRLIKREFTMRLRARGVRIARRPGKERRLWARRFWEATIRDAASLARRIDYVHFNPVRHGLVTRAADWPHSSFHAFVARGALPIDWTGASNPPPDSSGE